MAPFAAAGDTKAEARIEDTSSDGSVLFAQGCVVDEIAGFLEGDDLYSGIEDGTLDAEFAEYEKWISSPSMWLENKSFKDRELLECIKTMLGRFLRLKSSIAKKDRLEAFWKTLIYGRGCNGEIPDHVYSDCFHILLDPITRNYMNTAPLPRTIMIHFSLQGSSSSRLLSFFIGT